MITELRSSLAQAVGVDSKGQPPKVDFKRDTEDITEVTVYPVPGWKHWNPAARKALGEAVSATLPGEWEAVRFSGAGVSSWERAPDLPATAAYPGHIDGLAWHEIPAGLDGHGNVAVLDLEATPHAIVAGATGAGKTSFLRVAATHLLHHKVEVWAIDFNYAGLAFLEHRPGVTGAFGFAKSVSAIEALRRESEARQEQFRRDRSQRPPLVAIIDEVDSLIRRAKQEQKKNRGATQVPLVTDLQEVLSIGRKYGIHVILASQRPDTDNIPGAARDQAEGRIAVGKLSDKGAQMMLLEDAERAKNTVAGVKGRAVLKCGDFIGRIQGFWLGDTEDEKHSAADREYAESLLPERFTVDHSEYTDDIGMSIPPSAELRDFQDHVNSQSTTTVTKPATARMQAYRVKLRVDLAANSDDRRHGTQLARGEGRCKCVKCRPELHKADDGNE